MFINAFLKDQNDHISFSWTAVFMITVYCDQATKTVVTLTWGHKEPNWLPSLLKETNVGQPGLWQLDFLPYICLWLYSSVIPSGKAVCQDHLNVDGLAPVMSYTVP